MKLQSYYFDATGKAYMIAERIAREYRVKADKMPPAYQPEREAVLFITIESGNAPEPVTKFLKTLTVAKAKSVAFCIVGKNLDGLDTMKEALKDTGVKIHDNVYECHVEKPGLFKKAKLTQEQIDHAIVWTEEVLEAQQNGQ